MKEDWGGAPGPARRRCGGSATCMRSWRSWKPGGPSASRATTSASTTGAVLLEVGPPGGGSSG